LSFFICSSFFLLNNAAPENKIVTEVCQKVREKNLCLSSLSAEHAGQDAKDIAAVGLIAINVASNNGSAISVFIKNTLVDREHLGPSVEQNFEDCAENFDDAMQELDDALELITSKDFKNLKTEMGAAIDDADACAMLLNQSGGKDLELFNKANIFRQLCSIAYDIANIVAPN
ncbi:pectinesterase inhibitor-like, partial [Hibiscus syriacus]